VLRGGSFSNRGDWLRSALRNSDFPAYRHHNYGFRLARTFTP
jgi:formylglycine-generating enzyme required for sulfatase activity